MDQEEKQEMKQKQEQVQEKVREQVQEKVYLKKLELSTIESIINFVKAGLGIALVSKHIAQQANRDQMLQFHTVPQKYREVETGFISLTTEGAENVLNTVLDNLLFEQ